MVFSVGFKVTRFSIICQAMCYNENRPMRRIDLVNSLHRAILTHVPRRHRRHVRVLQAAITEVWVNAMNAGEQQAYADGVKATTPEKSAEDVGFEKGWRAGYEAGFQHVIGH